MIENTRKGMKPILDTESCEVYLVGPVNLQNSLLTFMIREEAEIPCFRIDEFVPSRFKSDRRSIVLLDGKGKSIEDLSADPRQFERLPPNCFVVAFNFRSSGRSELRKEIADRGIREIFFENASAESLLKGIRDVCRGNSGSSPRQSSDEGRGGSGPLTPHEKKILFMAASGASDEDIGSAFSITDRAVRNRLARIFFKIGAPNRLQATFWTAENF
jgi:DNA-binding NarL/FixJ family response regulator